MASKYRARLVDLTNKDISVSHTVSWFVVVKKPIIWRRVTLRSSYLQV